MAITQLLFIIVILAAIVILANITESRPELRPVLSGSLLAVILAFVLTFGVLPDNGTASTVLLSFGFGGVAMTMLNQKTRQRLTTVFPPRTTVETGQDAGQVVGYNPESPVHMTAMVLCILLLGNTVVSFALAGGMSGLTDEFRSTASGLVSPVTLLVQMAIFVLFGTLGVGLGNRRTFGEARERLGLRAPTTGELLAAFGVSILIFVAAFGISTVWQILAPPEVFREQNQFSGLLTSSLNTLTIGFLVSITAAVGEEIAFRGALQPIFGLWPTAVVFALTHIQYSFTPATLVIVAVALGLGWARKRYNTTTAIVAHFLYNFGSIALVIYAQYVFDLTGSAQ